VVEAKECEENLAVRLCKVALLHTDYAACRRDHARYAALFGRELGHAIRAIAKAETLRHFILAAASATAARAELCYLCAVLMLVVVVLQRQRSNFERQAVYVDRHDRCDGGLLRCFDLWLCGSRGGVCRWGISLHERQVAPRLRARGL